MSKRVASIFLLVVFVIFCGLPLVRAQAPQVNPDVYSQLRHRYIGPVGNRADAVAGIPGNPYIFTLERLRAAFSKRQTVAFIGNPFSMHNLFHQSALSPLIPIIQTSCGRARAKHLFAATSR